MLLSELTAKIISLDFDVEMEIYNNGIQRLLAIRPSELYKDYDINKNFQILLDNGTGNVFKPNHLRLLLDLYLCVKEHPQAKEKISRAFDNIFLGMEPICAVDELLKIDFPLSEDPIDILAYMAQLFIVEQNVGYGDKSKYNPPALYIQGWIRTFINSDKELDKIIRNIALNQPPAVAYTRLDDKNHKKYDPCAPELWYIK